MKNNPTNRKIEVNRNLYNFKFEGYKLNLNTDIKIIHHNLPSKVGVNSVKTYSHTPFKIIEARNRINFIFKNPWYSYGFFYIDENYSLVYILIDETTFEATYYNLFKIEEPSDENKNEYPTVAFVNENLLVLSDGAFNGNIYVLNFSDELKMVNVIKVISKKKLIEQNNFYEQNVYPVNLMYAKLSHDKKSIFILGYVYNANITNNLTTLDKSKMNKTTKTVFIVSLCEISIETSSLTASTDLKLISATKCSNSPIYGSIEDYINEKNATQKETSINEGNYVVISENDAFHEYISLVNNEKEADRIQNQDQNSTDNNESMVMEKQNEQIENQQPRHTNLYKWYQEMDDITLYLNTFELDKHRVLCKFSKRKIELSVIDRNNELVEIFNDELWDEVVPEECIWTIEKNKTKDGSIITLHFEKKNQVHWIQMFKEDDNVLETLDPSELANIKERLLMFTGNDNQKEGPYPNINSIQQTEECDMEKSPLSFVRVSQAGQITDINQGSGFKWLCTSFPTLETPYYMFDDNHYNPQQNDVPQDLSITQYLCLKQDVDGIILKLENHLDMSHCAVFNAFGFVEASKRNKKFAYISNDFEYALIAETSKLVYLYGQPTDEEAKRNVASQYLIDVSNPDFHATPNVDEKEELIHGIAQLDRHIFMILKRSSFCIFSIKNE